VLSINFRNGNQLNAQFSTTLLCFIDYFLSNMFWQTAIFREDYITLLYKTLMRLKCAVCAIILYVYFCFLIWIIVCENQPCVSLKFIKLVTVLTKHHKKPIKDGTVDHFPVAASCLLSVCS
jgi:Ni,Fe-hydrogenase I cytochrome b subunit